MRLESQARSLVGEEFRKNSAEIDVKKFVKPCDREINLEHVENVVNRAIEKFTAMPKQSDSWLSPRVHATLRLSRREAADSSIWDYLAVVAMPHYVRWRWRGAEVRDS